MAPASRIRLKHFLPQVFLATSLVVLVPSVIGWALRGTGIIDSEWVAIALVVLLSLAASDLGGRYWKTRSASGDLLFSELMVWGWLRRWWKERRLASVLVLLGGVESEAANDHQDRERRAQLLVDLADALEASDPYTHGHSHRVARHAEMVAVGMGLSDRDTAKIRTAAALHDVGKIHTPMAILHKPGRLTTEEFEVIKRHPAAGATMVAALGDPELEAMVRQHHERMDGSGYPARLAGQEICVGARIIAVADTFDAITSRRPYRSTKTHREALQILASEAGVTLDPNAVRGFQGYYWGRRPLAVWVSLTNIVGRLASSLGGGANLTVASVSRVVAASALTGASAAAISLPVLAAARPPSPDSGSVSAVPAALSVHGNPLPGSSGSPARQAAGAGGQAAHLGPSRVATGRGAATTGPSATAAVAVIPGLGVTLSPRTGATASGGPGVVLVTPSAGGGTVSAPSSGSPGQPASLGGGGGGSSSPAATTPAQGSTPTTEGRSGGGQGQGGGSGGQGGGGSGQGGGSGDGGSGGQGQGSGQGGGSGDGGGQGQGGGSSQGQGGGSGQGGGFAGGGSGNSGGSGGAGGSGDGGQGQGGGGGSGGQGQGGGQGNGGGGSDSGGAQGNGGGSGKGHTSST